MRKRALKKRREELRELLADRREALGELVLGMHVQGVWDDGLLARGAAEVREVEDGLNELETDGGSPEDRKQAPEAEAPPAEPEPTEKDEGEPEAEEAEGRGRGRRWRRRSKKGDGGSAAPAEPDRPSTTESGPHPEFETAEHTAEHRLPPAPIEKPVSETATRETPPEPPKEPASGSVPKETAAETPSGEAEETTPEPPAKTPSESTPRQPPAKAEGRRSADLPSPPESAAVADSGSETPGDREAGRSTVGKTATPGSSRLDALEARLEQEEREARTGVEAAKASVGAESGTEVASLIETLKKDREGLEQALGAASARLADADRRAGEASEKATRLEVENREAAARWIREQAAEIEADAAVAAELSETPQATAAPDGDRVRELEGEVSSLRSQLEDERREKTRAIEAAEARLREIETRAAEVEASAGQEAAGPNGAELREAAVTWLRGQIVALRREIEAGGGRDGGDS